jgi:hypothetical protein
MLGQPDGLESKFLASPPDHTRQWRAFIDKRSDSDLHAAALLSDAQ